MDAHRGQAVEAPAQDMHPPPLGRIQRRPLPDIALNIDRHEPQLERGDRGPPDRDRRVMRQQEVRPREDPLELARHLPRQLSQPERPAMHNTTQDMANSCLTVFVGLCLSFLILTTFVIVFYVDILSNGSYLVHWNTTQTNPKTSLSHVHKLVAIYEFTYACSIVARVLCVYKYWAQMAIYRYISLGLYATALFLALTNGHVIYELTRVGALISSHRHSSANEMVFCILAIYTLCFPVRYQMIVGSLVEWLVGLVLYLFYLFDSKHKATFLDTCTPIMAGFATLLVNVCVINIYSDYTSKQATILSIL